MFFPPVGLFNVGLDYMAPNIFRNIILPNFYENFVILI